MNTAAINGRHALAMYARQQASRQDGGHGRLQGHCHAQQHFGGSGQQQHGDDIYRDRQPRRPALAPETEPEQHRAGKRNRQQRKNGDSVAPGPVEAGSMSAPLVMEHDAEQ
jgi:hypothetical protein